MVDLQAFGAGRGYGVQGYHRDWLRHDSFRGAWLGRAMAGDDDNDNQENQDEENHGLHNRSCSSATIALGMQGLAESLGQHILESMPMFPDSSLREKLKRKIKGKNKLENKWLSLSRSPSVRILFRLQQ